MLRREGVKHPNSLQMQRPSREAWKDLRYRLGQNQKSQSEKRA